VRIDDIGGNGPTVLLNEKNEVGRDDLRFSALATSLTEASSKNGSRQSTEISRSLPRIRRASGVRTMRLSS